MVALTVIWFWSDDVAGAQFVLPLSSKDADGMLHPVSVCGRDTEAVLCEPWVPREEADATFSVFSVSGEVAEAVFCAASVSDKEVAAAVIIVEASVSLLLPVPSFTPPTMQL